MRRFSFFSSVFLLAMACLFFATSFALAKDFVIHGFVTEVKSPTSFEIDDYRITRDSSLVFDLAKESGGQASPLFKAEDIRVGTELEVKGEYDQASKELKAKSIKVFLQDSKTVKRTALLEKIPALTKQDAGWAGDIFADGQKISVVPSTVVTLKPNQAERKALSAKKDNSGSTALVSLDSLNLDTFVHYEGVRAENGSIQAKTVEFQHGELENGEARLWRHYDPKVKAPDYAGFVPGELEMHWKKYKILPNQQVQDYIAKIGESLIPEHQRDLPAGDPMKIPFRFYLVEAKSFNAVSYPNGVVVVHSDVFDVLQNEAQLAFVLSHEISHAVEKHDWEYRNYHRNELIGLRAASAFIPYGGGVAGNLLASGIQSQYQRSLENQADRVGLEWMLAAGYDIREAPASWKAVSVKQGDEVTNPFWSSHDNHTTRRSYLMAELRNNYSYVDFSQLKKDSDEFHQIADMVVRSEKAADAKK
jgi:hypothetical protein